MQDGVTFGGQNEEKGRLGAGGVAIGIGGVELDCGG